jgi:NAD-dependent SIR2 family protein deacetylase
MVFAPRKRFNLYCKWLKSLSELRAEAGLGLITTNYDMVADIAALKVAGVHGTYENWDIAQMGKKVDFGFRWVRPDIYDDLVQVGRPPKPRVSLFKLHGSTNWLRCPLCENLYINPNGPISWTASDEKASDDNLCHCSETRLEAQIVSPSFVRQMRDPNLIAVWNSALEFLRASDYWVDDRIRIPGASKEDGLPITGELNYGVCGALVRCQRRP